MRIRAYRAGFTGGNFATRRAAPTFDSSGGGWAYESQSV
jgi:hypothetical protein